MACDFGYHFMLYTNSIRTTQDATGAGLADKHQAGLQQATMSAGMPAAGPGSDATHPRVKATSR